MRSCSLLPARTLILRQLGYGVVKSNATLACLSHSDS